MAWSCPGRVIGTVREYLRSYHRCRISAKRSSMRASHIALIAAVLAIPSVGYSQNSGLAGPGNGPVGGKVGADLGASPTQSAPATRGPYGAPAPIGRPADYTGRVTPGQVVPDNVPVIPQQGGMGSAFVNGHRVIVDPSNRILRVYN
jgi:hypothetical protein